MSSLSVDDFAAFHEAVHGKSPFSWQNRLLRQVVESKQWPRVLNLPTGSGKTTCIDIALFALAMDAESAPEDRWCPRRICMVVDRRVVVDQVAERGRKLLNALVNAAVGSLIDHVAGRLRALSGEEGGEPLGVYTLRGGVPKDDGWARSPTQPLVVASTVDQVGSRLLVQGYGVSRGMLPVHAGLLGNDILILLDEVHLSQPFAQTLDTLSELRGPFANTRAWSCRFHHSFLSATPGASESPPFCLEDDEKAGKSPLAQRLSARKPARLEEVADRRELHSRCAKEAHELIQEHQAVAVVVNRVASAASICQCLKAELTREAGSQGQDVPKVVLLTGRMRPLDRDDVLKELLPLIKANRKPRNPGGRVVVVATQCIEAGADFDFDALVTEAASFDALKQRFGRVDRLGEYRRAVGVIVRDKSIKEDPIYGTAATATWMWLKGQAKAQKTKDVDFGILQLPILPENALKELVAPRPDAPVLMPAYLDLWVQTSPPPCVIPDVSLWLHGPEAGSPDVQVIWRADISEDDLKDAICETNGSGERLERLIQTVAAVRPSGLEAVSVPFVAGRRWLAGESISSICDVEGVGEGDVNEKLKPSGLAFIWRGDESCVVDAMGLRPGMTLVVPADRGGLSDLCFDGAGQERVTDLAERAALQSRGQPTLRLHPRVLEGLELNLSTEATSDAVVCRAELGTMVDDAQGWRRLWLASLANRGKSFVAVSGADDPWLVLQGKKLSIATVRDGLDSYATAEVGADLTSDENTSPHAGCAVGLARHSQDVEGKARWFATAAGLTERLVNDIALAGWLHDIGKADPRFQLMLHGGSKIELKKNNTLLAKSGMDPSARAVHRLAHDRSGYPRGARHEVQSLAMIEAHLECVRVHANDLDLVLHLVASHHGYCRPFAPAIEDRAPDETLRTSHCSAVFGDIDFTPVRTDHSLYRFDSPLAGRFWRLVRRYGWHELCWLEAILRLADHRASEDEQKE